MRSKVLEKILSETPESVRERVAAYGVRKMHEFKEKLLTTIYMTKQTVTIEIPEGYQVDKIDAATISFKPKPKDVLERILTDEDVLADNGHTWESFEKWCAGLAEDERATRFLRLLNKSLNGEWVPSIDSSDTRYEPWFIGGSSGFRYGGYGDWGSSSHVGSRLCFNTREKAIHAGTKFIKWYKIVITAK